MSTNEMLAFDLIDSHDGRGDADYGQNRCDVLL